MFFLDNISRHVTCWPKLRNKKQKKLLIKPSQNSQTVQEVVARMRKMRIGAANIFKRLQGFPDLVHFRRCQLKFPCEPHNGKHNQQLCKAVRHTNWPWFHCSCAVGMWKLDNHRIERRVVSVQNELFEEQFKLRIVGEICRGTGKQWRRNYVV